LLVKLCEEFFVCFVEEWAVVIRLVPRKQPHMQGGGGGGTRARLNQFCTVLLLKVPRVNEDFAVVVIVQAFSLVWTLLKTVKAI
jgi:hypothetical protein